MELGEVMIPPLDVELSDYDVVQPDLIFVHAENSNVEIGQRIVGTPDLLIEILSPANAHLDRTSKRKLYAQSGVRELWLVDPESKSIDLYDLLNKPAIPLKTLQKSEILTSPLLPGLTLQLEKIF